MKLMTINIWNYNRNWRLRRERIAGLIAEHRPDVLALQETRHDWRYERGRGQGEQIAELTGYHAVSRVAQVYMPVLRIDEGLTTLTRRPPIEVVECHLTMHPRERADENQRICLGVTVELEHSRVDVYNTHFSLSTVARRTNALEVARFVKEHSAREPAFLMGDLNAGPDTQPIRFLVGEESFDGETADFVDCWVQANPKTPGYTDPSWEPIGRIDFILGRNLPKPVRRVLLVGGDAPDGVYPSDHLGLVCEL